MKRAERLFSGSKALRIEVKVGVKSRSSVGPFSPAAGSFVERGEGTETRKSAMIRSESFRRSEDLRGERFLICVESSQPPKSQVTILNGLCVETIT